MVLVIARRGAPRVRQPRRRARYKLQSKMNHSCRPNAKLVCAFRPTPPHRHCRGNGRATRHRAADLVCRSGRAQLSRAAGNVTTRQVPCELRQVPCSLPFFSCCTPLGAPSDLDAVQRHVRHVRPPALRARRDDHVRQHDTSTDEQRTTVAMGLVDLVATSIRRHSLRGASRRCDMADDGLDAQAPQDGGGLPGREATPAPRSRSHCWRSKVSYG